MKNKFKFRVERNFSESISATFDFFRYNFKMIMKVVLRIPGPLIVLGALLLVPYYLETFRGIQYNTVNISKVSLALMFIGLFIYFLGSMLGFLAVNEYINLYQKAEDPQTIKVKDVYANVKSNFWRFIGAYFLVTLIIIGGFIALVIPAYYFMIALAFTFPVISMENKNASEAITRSFKIIKGNWWATFGFFLVLGILTVFISYIIVLPLSLLAGFMIVRPGNTGLASFLYAFSSILNLVLYFLISVILYIGVDIRYFSLVEKKEQVGLMEQIEQMDNDKESAE